MTKGAYNKGKPGGDFFCFYFSLNCFSTWSDRRRSCTPSERTERTAGVSETNMVKNFRCELCPTTFKQKFTPKKHVRAVHELHRLFQCTVCQALFQQKRHGTMYHLTVHGKLRQFGFDHCSASFTWRGKLKKRPKSIHGIDK